MSLGVDCFQDPMEYPFEEPKAFSLKSGDQFFFCQNVENQQHFLQDTLPILKHFFDLESSGKTKNLKILISPPHPLKVTLAPFVLECLELLGLRGKYEFARENTQYERIFMGTSFTHGGRSNHPPCRSSADVWYQLTLACLKIPVQRPLPKRFQVSRRSWIHGDTSNLGTNYTTRRKCDTEDQLVEALKKEGIQELFLEKLSMVEKVHLFANAELVVGFVGGGLTNLIFSGEQTKCLCILTPDFLRINQRFEHCMNQSRVTTVDACTTLQVKDDVALQMRAKIHGKQIGEICEVLETEPTKYRISLSQNDVAGFSHDIAFATSDFLRSDFELMDQGINSPFTCDVQKVIQVLKTV